MCYPTKLSTHVTMEESIDASNQTSTIKLSLWPTLAADHRHGCAGRADCGSGRDCADQLAECARKHQSHSQRRVRVEPACQRCRELYPALPAVRKRFLSQYRQSNAA